jgi:ribosomal protein L7/L12
MSMSNKWIAGIALSCVFQVGCVSKVAQQEQYSGFLANYQGLEEQTTPSEQKVLRWVAPGFDPRAYSTVVFKEVELYPAPKPTERANLKTLQDVQTMASNSIKTALAPSYTIVSNAKQAPTASRTLILQAAITHVSANNEGMHWYEAVPIGGIIGATQAATGHRDQTAEMFIEADLVDANTGLAVAKVVRKVFGATLKNASQPIAANDFKVALKDVTNDMHALLSKQ